MKSQFPLFWNDPHVRGITFWDFVQGHIWQKDAYLIRSDGSERPAMKWLVSYVRAHPRVEPHARAGGDPHPDAGVICLA